MKKSKVRSDLKLGFMERKIYNQLYSTIEKVIKSSYEIYYQYSKDSYVLTYEKFVELVNNKLKGD